MSSSDEDVSMNEHSEVEEDPKVKDDNESDFSDSSSESEEEVERDPEERAAQKEADKIEMEKWRKFPIKLIFGPQDEAIDTTFDVMMRSSVFRDTLPLETDETPTLNLGKNPKLIRSDLELLIKFIQISHEDGYYRDAPARNCPVYIPPSINVEDYASSDRAVEMLFDAAITTSECTQAKMLNPEIMVRLLDVSNIMGWKSCLDGVFTTICKELEGKTAEELLADRGEKEFTDENKAEVLKKFPQLK
jgi:hypothetical protein